jgi:hypothetical protein
LTRQSKRIATENKWFARTARVVDLKVEADGDLTLHSSYLSLTTAPTAPFVIEQPLLAPQPAAVTAARNHDANHFRSDGATNGKYGWSILEGEINAAGHHAEVVVPPVHNIPAEIVHPADVRSDANFQAGTELADRLSRGTQVIGRGNGENDEITARQSLMKMFFLAAAEDGTAPRPNIWRKARTRDRISQGERA